MSFLLKKGALPNALDGAYRVLLHVPAEEGRLAAVNALLAAGVNTSFGYEKGKGSTLDLATAKGLVDVVSALTRSGANVDVADSAGCTALHETAHHNEVDVIDALMKG